jgi:hypothetical protein
VDKSINFQTQSDPMFGDDAFAEGAWIGITDNQGQGNTMVINGDTLLTILLPPITTTSTPLNKHASETSTSKKIQLAVSINCPGKEYELI